MIAEIELSEKLYKQIEILELRNSSLIGEDTKLSRERVRRNLDALKEKYLA